MRTHPPAAALVLAAAVPRGNHQVVYPAQWWSDPCEAPLAWTGGGTGADWTVDLLAAAAYRGATGLRLKTRVTDPADNDNVIAWRTLAYPAGHDLTFRFYVALPDPTHLLNFQAYVTVYDGADHHEYGLLWYPNTGSLCYVSTGALPIDIPSLNHQPAAGSWHQLSVTIDPVLQTYLSATRDGITADLTGAASYDVGNGVTHEILPSFALNASALAPGSAYVDDVQLLKTPNP